MTNLEVPTWFLTFTTYGTWLHGDPRGSVDLAHNVPGTPKLPANEALYRHRASLLKQPPFVFEPAARAAAKAAIKETCAYRHWHLWAINIRMAHVHVVASGADSGDRMMNDLKAYATRRMVRDGRIPRGRRVWTEGGYVASVSTVEALERVCWYVLEEQGLPLGETGARPEAAS